MPGLAGQDILSPTIYAHSSLWLNLNIQSIPPSHRLHFDSGYGCFRSWPDCVGCLHTYFSELGSSISAAFAIITGVFRENKGGSWSHAAHIAATRYLFSFKWDLRTLRSYVGVTTSQVYQNWARGENQEVLTDILPEGAKLHWIGPRRDRIQDRVFLFFHGESTPSLSIFCTN